MIALQLPSVLCLADKEQIHDKQTNKQTTNEKLARNHDKHGQPTQTHTSDEPQTEPSSQLWFGNSKKRLKVNFNNITYTNSNHESNLISLMMVCSLRMNIHIRVQFVYQLANSLN